MHRYTPAQGGLNKKYDGHFIYTQDMLAAAVFFTGSKTGCCCFVFQCCKKSPSSANYEGGCVCGAAGTGYRYSRIFCTEAGGKRDFYSEGDYWWPDPVHPDSPYIRKDGLTNPDNFVDHRKAMIRFSSITGSLASAHKITGDEQYVRQAVKHYKAWFADTATMMHPHFLYAQAIRGRFTGRGTGIIDSIQLIEAVQALMVMKEAREMYKEVLDATKKWFEDLLKWLTMHQYGKDEMNAANNHGTCWVMQEVAVFAKFTGDTALMKFCSNRYKNVLLAGQMAADGSFPLELKRTKPYGYSIFNLDAMAIICQALTSPGNDLWHFTTEDGRSIKKELNTCFHL